MLSFRNFFAIFLLCGLANADVIRKASRILLDARVNFQWAPKTNAEALIGLILANPNWYTPTNADAVASVQAMDIELLAALAQDDTLSARDWSRGKTAIYVTAIQATCRDPSDFYGYNLLALVQQHMTDNSVDFQNNRFALSWTVIALCNNDVDIDATSMATLVANTGNYKYGVDEAAMILMATTCLSKRQTSPEVELAAAAAQQYIIDELTNNFDNYNQYSIGLAVQALIAANANAKALIKKSLKYLKNEVRENGKRFMIFPLAGNQVLPALARKSFLDVVNVTCGESNDNTATTTTTTTTPSSAKLVDISITANDFNSKMGMWQVTDSIGKSLFEFMVKLNDTDSTFSFNTQTFSFGESVRAINGLYANSSLFQYWQISKEGTGPLNTGVSSTYPNGGENYVFNLTTWA